MLGPEDEGITILWNITDCSPHDKVSHPKRPDSSAAMLQEPVISQMKVCLILGLYLCMSFVELQSSETALVFQCLPILPCQPGIQPSRTFITMTGLMIL